MADLAHLHEAAILYNLKRRHFDGNPYTRVGDIMVALNPFQWIDGLYSEEKQLFYAKVRWFTFSCAYIFHLTTNNFCSTNSQSELNLARYVSQIS
jgi:hypothetical protein